jgi:hypothetical protein
MKMKKALTFAAAFALAVAMTAFAQQRGGEPPHHTANGGHPPPPPTHHEAKAPPEGEKMPDGRIDNRQHVSNDHWYGHPAVNDSRFKISHPYEHGRFENVGPSFTFNVLRVDTGHHRFWFPGGFGFEVASWDWTLCSDWCWNCGDNFVVYDDPDHPGWYLLYNMDTGTYVHVQYVGTT